MKINQVIKGALGVCVLAGMAVLTGCSCAPVRESLVEQQTYEVAPVTQTRIHAIAPVAESCAAPCAAPIEATQTFCN